MEHSFWRERWRENKLGFHQLQTNEFLFQYAERLAPGPILAPLSGKSRDLSFLAAHGHPVVACELVEDAVRAFYDEQQIPYTRRLEPQHVVYQGAGVTSYAGDFFRLTPAQVGPVSGVFDRAALVALPPALRSGYVSHLLDFLAPGGSGLLVVVEYQVPGMQGPPFSIPPEEVAALFGPRCEVEPLSQIDRLAQGGPRIQPGTTLFVERAYWFQVRG